MNLKMERPAADGTANGANIEAAGFSHRLYPVQDDAATAPFTPVGIAALRVLHLVNRHSLNAEQAAMIAGLIYGEGSA
ncbi:hypothetical protein [Paracoccus ravus]|uniref:hypothetical protein n=1 Tax=Paracoccus ravus TaxID=2447760 RepID=UPI00106EBE2A|nr:hypothetical protein [Paracoccus ravus]